MISNICINDAEASRLLKSVRWRVPGKVDYSCPVLLTISLQGDTLSGELTCGEYTKSFESRITEGSLPIFDSDDLFIAASPELRNRTLSKLQLSKSCIEHTCIPTAVSNTAVNVNSPLLCEVRKGKLILKIDYSSPDQGFLAEQQGLLSLNGLLPDANGNISILSASDLVFVNVYTDSAGNATT